MHLRLIQKVGPVHVGHGNSQEFHLNRSLHLYISKEIILNIISHWYKKEIFAGAYNHYIKGLNGIDQLPETEGIKPLPRIVRRMPGRPKHKRKKDVGEKDNGNRIRLSQVGRVMHCKLCKEFGHNIRGCPGRPETQIEKPSEVPNDELNEEATEQTQDPSEEPPNEQTQDPNENVEEQVHSLTVSPNKWTKSTVKRGLSQLSGNAGSTSGSGNARGRSSARGYVRGGISLSGKGVNVMCGVATRCGKAIRGGRCAIIRGDMTSPKARSIFLEDFKLIVNLKVIQVG